MRRVNGKPRRWAQRSNLKSSSRAASAPILPGRSTQFEALKSPPQRSLSDCNESSSNSSDSNSDDSIFSDLDSDGESDCSSVTPDELEEDYDRLIEEFTEEGPTLANRGEVSEAIIRTEAVKWIQ